MKPLSFSLATLLVLLCGHATGQTLGCSLRSGAARSACSQVTKTLGDSFNDTGYAHEIFNLTRAFSVQPGFFACLETGGPNAFATIDTVEPGTRGSVFLGITLARGELQRTGQYNNFTLPAILAHEVGHIVQFREGNRLATKLTELQADYLAGWYMANRDRGAAGWSETSVRQNLTAFFKLGDYDYNSPDHHGTPEERVAAIVAGFRSANLSLQAVYQASYRFVTSQSQGSLDDAQPDNSSTASNESNEPGARVDDLHQVLQQLIASAGSGFRNLRGQVDPYSSGQAWIARLALHGGEDCVIWRADSGYGPHYSCVMAKNSSRDKVQSAYERFVDQIESALGREWTKETDSPQPRLAETTFKKPGSDVEFDVYVVRMRGTYRLEVDAQQIIE